MKNMKAILKLLRPHQWAKNSFVFLPLFFNGKFTNLEFLFITIIVFFVFSFAASGIYCFNDILDAEKDKLHSIKRHRPIASGNIGKCSAFFIMLICFIISLLTIYFFSSYIKTHVYNLYWVIAIYILMNIFYCIKLKKMIIVDVFVIAIGFVLRIFAGGLATGILLSHWLVLMTFLLALLLAFAKRRDDVVIYEQTGLIVRNNINGYNLSFMNQAVSIIASITMVCYIMYTVSPEVVERFQTSHLYITCIFVLAGIIRYLQITIVDAKSGSPTEVLMHDRFLQVSILGWLLAFVLIIYVL